MGAIENESRLREIERVVSMSESGSGRIVKVFLMTPNEFGLAFLSIGAMADV